MVNNILYLDAGNSAIKWAVANSDGLSEMISSPYPEYVSVDYFIGQWKDIKKPMKVIVSCVAPEIIWQALEKSCYELWGINAQRITSSKQSCGLINAYSNASDLGSDRWCAMIGAYHVAESAFMLVDAGSALTIDLVSEDGQHLGGYISPGLSMMKQSLGLKTAQINIDSQYSIPSLSLGKSTIDGVGAGIYLSVVNLIEAVFDKESKQFRQLDCFLTGGDAKLIAELLSIKYVMMPDVVIRGLAEIQKSS